MSYDISSQVQNRRALADLRVQEETEDSARMEFLRRLYQAGLKLTPWETQFVNDFIASPRGFTPKQRESVDDIKKQYGHRL
jgi:hypothetical protein